MGLKRVLVLLMIFVAAGVSFGQVRLPAIISNNMVVQQNSDVPIWGWAEPGEKVVVVFAENEPVKTVAGKDGRWQVSIKTPPAGGSYKMTVTGTNTLKVRNILTGEVWLASGQSNMEMPVAHRNKWFAGVPNYPQELVDANYPKIRLFQVKRASSDKPANDCMGWWSSCSAATVANFSAVGYFFARELHNKLGVPIGVIDSTFGGSPVEAWMSEKVLKSDTALAVVYKQYAELTATYPQRYAHYKANEFKKWQEAVEKAKAEGKKPPLKPWAPFGPAANRVPSGLYNGMIAPLVPYSIKGAIWYQGESNSHRPYQYRKLFPAMIKDWRNEWGRGEFPFYYVQIAPFHYRTKAYTAELREAQLMTMSLANTGMAVSMDVGDVDDIHPRNKQAIGKRLSLWALAKTYGYSNIVYSGPIYKSMKIEGRKISLSFDYADNGLTAKAAELTSFQIAGNDKKFFEAQASIKDKTVIVSSDMVVGPVAVRYAWGNAAVGNLFNNEGLPASPFRTDDWCSFAADKSQ